MNTGIRLWSLETRQSEQLDGTLGLGGLKAVFAALTGDTTQRLAADVDGARCLRVVGALDKRVARAVKAQARAFVSKPGAWTIDLSGVDAWDGDGLASLVYALDVSELNGCELRLVDPSPALRAVLQQAQLHHLFAIALGGESA